MKISKRDRQLFEEAAGQHLTEQERRVLWLYYGLDEGQHRSFEEIGLLLGLGADAVREIRNRAVHGLRGVPEAEASGVLLQLESPYEPRIQLPFEALEMRIEPGDCDARDIADLYGALSDLYRAYGGVGLTFRSAKDVEIVAGAL